MSANGVTEYMSQDETIHVTWYAGDTEYAASDRRIGMLQGNDFRDLPYSEVESVRTTIKTIDGERDGTLGLIKTVVQLGLGVLGGFMMLTGIFGLFNGSSLTALVFLIFAPLPLYGGLRGYRGWKQRSRETRDQPFVVFELGQKTTVDIDMYLERAEVNSETQQLEIPVPDKNTMKTVTSTVR
jgi:hypothetical protein